MRTLAMTKQFRRDHKRCGELSAGWIEILYKLLNDEALPPRCVDHSLGGNWQDFRDCHIKPDLVLIYRKYDNVLELVRLGSHSELDL